MAYCMVYLCISCNCYNSRYGKDSGWTSDTNQAAFKEESRRIFQELGWDLHAGHNGVCDTVTKGDQDLYLHPTSFSGVLDEANIQPLLDQLSKARTFQCYHFDCYEEYLDMSDEEYRAALEARRGEITSFVLEQCRTKRSILYITDPVADCVAQQFEVCRLCDKDRNNGVGNVLELLRQIENDWPSGTVWGTHNTPGTYKNEIPSTEALRLMRAYGVNGTYACGGYASMVSSLLFGDTANPARRVEDLSQIRPGDIIFFIVNDTGKPCHVTVALESPNGMNAFHYTDGNNGAAVYWPDAQHPYSRENLDCYGTQGKAFRVEAWTRYPENVPYTGKSVNVWGN